ncbi:3-oxoacyl-[acyl-carrier protein] reductase [Pseudovibrio denitrificans]|uniref:3-oxoacyl-[acyl-carrier protein] reductase n=1 Tax=Pseudovibrio denitrificans TaxID=258256 RepID=A0A1I7CTQ0_9HYPH|nr:glucose 1-dehydrogenase [Pseudovibrio denitrificans]SFU02795.1 3-oxoacyl-[acyl-carrier protein] reductase [Pseudovibrio denitrificans]
MLSSNLLAGKVALVTGASRGIGLAIVKRFALEGASVYMNSRSEGSIDELAKQISADFSADVQPLYFDVTDSNAVQKAVWSVAKKSGRLDVLVNNAGIMRDAMIAMSSDSLIRDNMAVNFEGSFYCSRIAARIMMKQSYGSIINLSSIIGTVGVGGHSAYAASKSAVIGMSHAMAKELAPKGVRVNVLAPGFIETDLTENIKSERRKSVIDQIMMGRAGTPNDVANVALFLASDLSQYVSNQVIGVDGCMVT